MGGVPVKYMNNIYFVGNCRLNCIWMLKRNWAGKEEGKRAMFETKPHFQLYFRKLLILIILFKLSLYTSVHQVYTKYTMKIKCTFPGLVIVVVIVENFPSNYLSTVSIVSNSEGFFFPQVLRDLRFPHVQRASFSLHFWGALFSLHFWGTSFSLKFWGDSLSLQFWGTSFSL